MNQKRFLLNLFMALIFLSISCQRKGVNNITIPFNATVEKHLYLMDAIINNSDFIRDFESDVEIAGAERYFYTDNIEIDSIEFSIIFFLEYLNGQLVFLEVRSLSDKKETNDEVIEKFINQYRNKSGEANFECTSVTLSEDEGFKKCSLQISRKID